jgi:hypothetical protein
VWNSRVIYLNFEARCTNGLAHGTRREVLISALPEAKKKQPPIMRGMLNGDKERTVHYWSSHDNALVVCTENAQAGQGPRYQSISKDGPPFEGCLSVASREP